MRAGTTVVWDWTAAAGAALAALSAAALLMTAFPSPAKAQATPSGPQSDSDWARQCQGDRCWIQTGLTDDQGRLVALLTMRRRSSGAMVGEIRAPLGLHIPSGVRAQVDDAMAFQPTLIACDNRFCLAAFTPTDELVAAMKRGDKLIAQIADARNGQRVALSFSLIGFTAQYDTL